MRRFGREGQNGSKKLRSTGRVHLPPMRNKGAPRPGRSVPADNLSEVRNGNGESMNER